MKRKRGLSVRVKLTLSYAGVVLLTGALLLAVVYVFLLRYVPAQPVYTTDGFVPTRPDLVRAFAPAATVVLGGLLLFGLVGGWFLAGRVLSPVAQLIDATRIAATGSLAHRIRLGGRDDEFRELADAFDHMLARIEADVSAQQRFAANASHELRTPLTVMQSLLEVAVRHPPTDARPLLERLQGVNTRAIQLTQALLLLARADREVADRATVDLSLLAEEAAETLHQSAHSQGIDLVVSGESALTRGSEALLLQVVTNLVQNAIVHNLRPNDSATAGRWVAVRTYRLWSSRSSAAPSGGVRRGPGRGSGLRS